MPFAFAIIGLVFTIAGVRGTSGDLLTLLKNDFTGDSNFIYWVLSIAVIGSLGYVDALRPLSRAFLVLVIIVLILAEDKKTAGGFFATFQDSIAEITAVKGAA
jgi:hypothetical protein